MRVVTFLVCALLLCGCAAKKPSGPVHEYGVRGEVVSLDAKNQIATLKHEKIEGWMEAMTMGFPVKERAEFEKLRTGMRITAKIYQREGDLEFWIAGIQQVPSDGK
jgi:Cu/Ag efflux protein CusF